MRHYPLGYTFRTAGRAASPGTCLSQQLVSGIRRAQRERIWRLCGQIELVRERDDPWRKRSADEARTRNSRKGACDFVEPVFKNRELDLTGRLKFGGAQSRL